MSVNSLLNKPIIVMFLIKKKCFLSFLPFYGWNSSILIIDDTDDGSEFTEDNASTTETEDAKMSEDIEDMEEEGLDGVSSEGEKTTGGADNVEVRFISPCIHSNYGRS